MKQTISFLFIFACLITNSAMASMAKSFVCTNSTGTKMLVFVPEETESLAQRCLYVDEHNSWQHQEIHAQGDFYTISLKPGCEASRANNADNLASIELWLPKDREIRSYQSGGYYFPIITSVPFRFSTMVFGKSLGGEVIFREVLDCQGS